MAFRLPYNMYNIWPLMKLKGQIKGKYTIFDTQLTI